MNIEDERWYPNIDNTHHYPINFTIISAPFIFNQDYMDCRVLFDIALHHKLQSFVIPFMKFYFLRWDMTSLLYNTWMALTNYSSIHSFLSNHQTQPNTFSTSTNDRVTYSWFSTSPRAVPAGEWFGGTSTSINPNCIASRLNIFLDFQ